MLLYILISAFTIWMIIDAVRRRADYYWFLIIIFFAPIGGVIYFFMVKAKDFRAPAVAESLPKRSVGPSLAQLRQLALESPSIANRLNLADALRESRKFSEAIPEYEFVLQRDGKCREALHGVALCLLELEKPGEAVTHLTKLMDLDARYRDYAAAMDYAEALWLDGRRELALEVLEDLATTSTRIDHRLAYANYLALADEKGSAREVLEAALKDYEQSPSFVQRRDRDAARDAEKLLAQLG